MLKTIVDFVNKNKVTTLEFKLVSTKGIWKPDTLSIIHRGIVP